MNNKRRRSLLMNDLNFAIKMENDGEKFLPKTIF